MSAAVHRQRVVDFGVGVLVAAVGEGAQRRGERDEVEADEIVAASPVKRAGLDEDDGRAPLADEVAEGARVELVVVAPDVPSMKGASASTITAHSFLLRTRPGVFVPAASDTTASSETVACLSVSPTEVREFWLWRLKPISGRHSSRSFLSRRPSGVASVRASRLMSIDLEVAALEQLGAVRVEHRHGAQSDLFFDRFDPRLLAVGFEGRRRDR